MKPQASYMWMAIFAGFSEMVTVGFSLSNSFERQSDGALRISGKRLRPALRRCRGVCAKRLRQVPPSFERSGAGARRLQRLSMLRDQNGKCRRRGCRQPLPTFPSRDRQGGDCRINEEGNSYDEINTLCRSRFRLRGPCANAQSINESDADGDRAGKSRSDRDHRRCNG